MRATRFCKMFAMAGGLAGLVAIGPCDASSAAPTEKSGVSRIAETRSPPDKVDPANNKAESLEKVHDRHVGCAAIAAAAVDDTRMLESRSEKEKTEARTILTATKDKALATGKSLGLTPGAVERAITRQKDGILKKMKQTEGPAAEKEKSDLGRVLVACALVDKLER